MAKPENAGRFPQAAIDNMKGDENRSPAATEALTTNGGNVPVPTQPEYNVATESSQVRFDTLIGTPGEVDYFVFRALDQFNDESQQEYDFDTINGF